MIPSEWNAYLVERDASRVVQGALRKISLNSLPPGDVVIRAQWSSLNFKDALAATGHPGVARKFPHVPGIDVAGTVVEVAGSNPGTLQVGDQVLVTGYELGAGQWGGWSEYVRVSGEWVIPLPRGLTLREAMALGTAGFTAAQCVASLQHHGITPGSGDIVVTGATGGVGCVAVMLLSRLGYRICAVTGKPAWHERLKGWGVAEILPRETFQNAGDKPLLPGRWAGAVDTVGGDTLAAIIRQTQDHGCVTACGMVGGVQLGLSVYPFILRGVTLAGITSSGCLRAERERLWQRLAGEWRLPELDSVTTEVALAEIDPWIQRILAGEVAGRTVIKIQ